MINIISWLPDSRDFLNPIVKAILFDHSMSPVMITWKCRLTNFRFGWRLFNSDGVLKHKIHLLTFYDLYFGVLEFEKKMIMINIISWLPDSRDFLNPIVKAILFDHSMSPVMITWKCRLTNFRFGWRLFNSDGVLKHKIHLLTFYDLYFGVLEFEKKMIMINIISWLPTWQSWFFESYS